MVNFWLVLDFQELIRKCFKIKFIEISHITFFIFSCFSFRILITGALEVCKVVTVGMVSRCHLTVRVESFIEIFTSKSLKVS